MPETENRLLNAALFYRGLGWSVIPCEPRGKRPLVKWEPYQHQAADEGQIWAWWTEKPDANIAVITGSVSGVLVLDVDGPDGEQTLTELPEIEPTPHSRTGKGGHYWFQHPGDGEYRNFAKKLPGLDFRGDGGYVIAPPSIHPNGAEYRWVVAPTRQPMSGTPAWLKDQRGASTNGSSHVIPPAGAAASLPDYIGQGERNQKMTSLAGSMRRRGAGEGAIMAALREENSARCVPPLEDRELGQITKSVMRYPPGEVYRPVTMVPPGGAGQALPPSLAQRHHLTDVGNAKRMVARHGKDLRYCHVWGKWLVWDGRRWEIDATDEVSRRAKDTALGIYFEAAAEPEEEEDRRKALAKHAARTENEARVRAMINLASSEPSIPARTEEIDADPWLLAVKNGTLDLRTGMLREHRREDLITKMAPVEYDGAAKCPTWGQFLSRIMGNNLDLIDFLQKAVGYGLTGDVREQCLFLLYGTGQNGKSTFLETMAALLGDYATQTPTETLMAKGRDGGVPNDVARLKGARFVSAIETEEGRRMAEVLVKQLTGGDRIVARFLHHEFFDFRPTFKLFLAANHKPVIRGTDHAIWRRIRMVPFSVTIPDEERDGQLGEKLRAELPGILNWALDGCQAWQEDGLGPPEEVKAATAGYRAEMDVMGEFISENCVVSPTLSATARDLYASYVAWCERSGEFQINQRAFGMRLGERGFDPGRGGGGVRMWKGIGLSSDASDR